MANTTPLSHKAKKIHSLVIKFRSTTLNQQRNKCPLSVFSLNIFMPFGLCFLTLCYGGRNNILNSFSQINTPRIASNVSCVRWRFNILYRRASLDFHMVAFTGINNHTDLQISIHTPFIECFN